MTQTVPVPAPSADVPLDAERLDVYRVGLEFLTLMAPILRGRGLGALRSQLDRASLSILLNIAEGAGRRSGPDKASFYTIARGSATECAGILDALVVRGLVGAGCRKEARTLLIRIVQMLTRLIASWA
jgi:four helix bundle protein